MYNLEAHFNQLAFVYLLTERSSEPPLYCQPTMHCQQAALAISASVKLIWLHIVISALDSLHDKNFQFHSLLS